MVTLTGVGGVGKTRLALEVAAQLSDEFPDGVWVFELAAVGEAAAVPDAVAAVLGITQQPGMTMSKSVAAALEGRVRMLVFDNCEHVLDAVADLAEAILAASGTTTIFATSREGLGLADEQVWPVRSLTIEPATELFVERAHQVAPNLLIDNDGWRCGGLPTIGRNPVGHRAGGVADVLDGGGRDPRPPGPPVSSYSWARVARQSTIDAPPRRGVGLPPSRRHGKRPAGEVFGFRRRLRPPRRLHRSGVEDETPPVMDLLDALVRKSLLVADRSSRRTRFSMLETIRDFAEGNSSPAGGADHIRTAHAHDFAGGKPTSGAVGRPTTARGL